MHIYQLKSSLFRCAATLAAPTLLITSLPAIAAENDNALEEVVVTGMRANLQESIQVKRADDLIVEAIAADSMGKLPNVTVAESLVRLPGVNGARDRGNESLATVRGLGPRMTMGTVNGREIASSEPTRAVRWEVFPTEVVSTVKVYKTQSADLIAGGIASTIDISTVNPLGVTDSAFVATGGPVYYDAGEDVPGYSPWGNRMGLSWVGELNENLGVAFGATYQKQKNANALMGSWGYTDDSNSRDVNGDGTVDYTTWGAGNELKQLEQTRNGAMGVVQWRNDNFELKLDGLYSKVKIREDQNQTWFNNWAYSIWSGSNPYTRPGSSYTIIDGDVVAGTLANSDFEVNNVIGKYDEDKDLTAAGLNGKWEGENWTLSADLSYSEAQRDNNWRAVWFASFPDTVSFDFRDGVTPFISATDADLARLDGSSNGGPGALRDEITALTASARREFDGTLTAIEFGARAAEREKRHRSFTWDEPITNPDIGAYAGLTHFFAMPDLNVPRLLDGDLDAIAEVGFGGFDEANAREQLLTNWRVKEDVTEGYLKGVYDSTLFGTPVNGNIGVRVTRVDTTSIGYDSIGGVTTPSTAENSYTDVLPSATLNFMLSEDHVLRLAAAKVVARPPLDELRTGRSLADPVTTVGQLTGSGGNPSLDPFRATQVDLSYEWYFHEEALMAIAGYRKWVDSIVGYKRQREVVNGEDYLITGPFNGGGGYINGLELTFQTPFYFIPNLENFGIYSNYSFVDSDLHEFSPEADPLPLSGLAEHTAAVDLWYSTGTFEARLGYKYHSPYTIIYGWSSSALSRLQSEEILDFSTSWQVTDMLGLKLQIGNLTNEKLRAYFDNQPNRLANKDATGGYQSFGRRYALEATVRF